MYKLMWAEGEDPDTLPPQTSPKDIVANILRETELPDLNLQTDSRMSQKSSKQGLSTEQELFSIDDDDDYDFEEETFNINSRVSLQERQNGKEVSKPEKGLFHLQQRGGGGGKEVRQVPVGVSYTSQEPADDQRVYERRQLAKVPPQVSVQHPRLSHLEEGAVVSTTNSFNTYLEQASRDNNNEEPGARKGHKTSLLPMDPVEMEFDDDMDSGVAETEHDTHGDTQPIVTLDQGKLAARWRTRKQKINFAVALCLVFLGVVVLTVALILIIRMVRTS